MEADPAVPSAFGEKDQQFVFGQSGPSSQPMLAGNGMQFQSNQPVFSFPANQWPPDVIQKTPALNDGEGGSNQIPPQLTSHGFDPHTIFTTAQWKPKDPPCFHGKSSEDAHTWVDRVRNYFVFMNGTPRQEVLGEFYANDLKVLLGVCFGQYLLKVRNTLYSCSTLCNIFEITTFCYDKNIRSFDLRI